MSTGHAYRPFWHDLHFNAAWSFQIAVVRARDRTSANRIQGGLSAKPVDGDLTQPTLSAPKWAAAIAAPVAESSPHSSNKSITYMKFRLEFGTRKPGLHVLCAQAGSSKWNFFHGWRVLLCSRVARHRPPFYPCPLGWGRSLKLTDKIHRVRR